MHVLMEYSLNPSSADQDSHNVLREVDQTAGVHQADQVNCFGNSR